jgi:hypothetical protein
MIFEKNFDDPRWLDSYLIWKPFFGQTYSYCELLDINNKSVLVKDIIGLSRPPKEINNDKRTKQLRQSVANHGWVNNYFNHSPVHLYKLPYGKYVVGSDGNHRTYFADKEYIDCINAEVTIIIPNAYIPEETKSTLVELQEAYFKDSRPELNDIRKEILLGIARELRLLD